MATRIFFSSFALLALTAPASADLVLGLAWNDGTPSAGVRSVTAGETLLVDLFISDPDGDPMGTTRMIAEGLGNGGGSIYQTDGTAVVNSAAAATANPDFDLGLGGASPDAMAAGFIDGFTAGAFFAPVGQGLSNITLGTFSIMALGGVGDTAEISANVFDTSGMQVANATFDIFSPNDLDAILADPLTGTFGSLQLQINSAAVPEASTMLVGGLLLVGFLVIRRRQKATTLA